MNHYIVKNILIFIVVIIIIANGSLFILKRYTRHGEALSVPDVREMTLAEAGKLLQQHQLRWQLSDSVYVASVRPGAVVNQYPEQGSKVKKNRNIFLVVNALAPEKVKMPNVVGVSFRQAKTTLESQGLTIGQITYEPDMAENNGLKQMYRGQEIRRGIEIAKGSEIDLVLGSGLSNELTRVPRLLGLSLPEARETLTKYSLKFGVIIYDHTVASSVDSAQAVIYQQRPIADGDAMLQLGSTIDVWVSKENRNISTEE